MDVAAGRRRRSAAEQVLQDELVQDAHAQAAPVGAVVGDEPSIVASERSRAVSQRPSATVPKPSTSWSPPASIASQAARQPVVALADRRTSNSGTSRSASSSAVRPGKPETSRCVGRITRPGSLMPTSIIMQKFAGSSGPRELAGGGQVVAVLQARLVAVVAVGDEDRPSAIRPCTVGVRCWSVTGQSRFDAEVVGRLERRPVAQARLDGVAGPRPSASG